MIETQVRTYSAPSQGQAAAAFIADASTMATYGYEPVNQAWAAAPIWRRVPIPALLIVAGYLAGSALDGMSAGYSALELLGAAFGGLMGIGFLLVARPNGTLTVTYVRRAQGRSLLGS
jgi:hypothetical protein